LKTDDFPEASMDDTRSAVRDDAPVTTAKSRPDDAATQGLIAQGGEHVVGRAVTIRRPAAELYAYFRDFSRLATFMENVERVDMLSPQRSHWVVRAPGGGTVEWDAIITEEREGERICWASEDGADVANAGCVEFRDAGERGTVVVATIAYDPPGGTIGKLIAKIFQREPAIQARRDLRRFKQLMETGEIATSARTRAQIEEERG
jgi:uncharacterized membrane protein